MKIKEEEEYKEAEMIADGIYENFSDFVTRDKVKRDDFLKDNPMYVTKYELLQWFLNVGFAITDDEVEAIMKHHRADKTDYLLIDDFMAKLTCWRALVLTENEIDKQMDLNINNLRDKSGKPPAPKQNDQKKPKLKVKSGGGPKQTQKKTGKLLFLSWILWFYCQLI